MSERELFNASLRIKNVILIVGGKGSFKELARLGEMILKGEDVFVRLAFPSEDFGEVFKHASRLDGVGSDEKLTPKGIGRTNSAEGKILICVTNEALLLYDVGGGE